MGTRIAIPLLLLCLLCATACGKGDAGRNDEVPANLRGNYGQKPEQAQLPTVGLEVDAHALRLGELTITIVQGEASAAGDFHVTRAEARWEKREGESKTCKGTVSRQDNTLLVKLFDADSDERCEDALEGEWNAWARTDALPERVLGTYGYEIESNEAAIGLRIEPKTIGWVEGGENVQIVEVVRWLDEPDEAFVRASKYAGINCIGSVVRDAEQIMVVLSPAAGSPDGVDCLSGGGIPWTLDEAHLPKTKSSNGKVDIEAAGGKLVLVAKDIGLRCEQSVLRSSERPVSGNDRLGVPGGVILVLEPAVPTGGTEACRQRIRKAAQSQCTEETGAPCSPDELPAFASDDLQCPRQIAIGEPVGGRRKAALMPKSTALLACWDMTGDFKGS